MRDKVAARRYARALFDATGDTLKRKAALHDLQGLAELLQALPTLGTTLANPALKGDARARLVGDVASRLMLQPLTRRFLELLVERQRVGMLPDVAEVFGTLLAQAENRLHATVVSAAPLSPMQLAPIQRMLETRTGKKVELKGQTDASLLAGVVVRMGDMEMDLSLRSNLARLQDRLSKG
jgi:F-type H+-transporting ATPase subunit delta